MEDNRNTHQTISPWRPLQRSLFRSLWIAAVASNMATWMHDVGAAWLMTSLAPSPLMVSMVQVSTSLPLFVFALPAGALADVFDRRRLLLITQSWMLVVAAGLALMTVYGQTGPLALLLFTVAIGVGTAFNAPAWQAIVPEIVSREELPAAVALNSAGINIARAVGPALGGIVVARLGPGAAFGLNALSFIGVVLVLFVWKKERRIGSLPPEHFFGAMLAGLRYTRHATGFKQVLGRVFCFMFPASALWALLPLLAKQELRLGAGGYGVLLGAVGLGAVSGAFVLPRLRKTIAVDRLTTSATLGYGLVLLALATVRSVPLLIIVMLVSGAMWITMLTALNVAAQTTDNGRGRGSSQSRIRLRPITHGFDPFLMLDDFRSDTPAAFPERLSLASPPWHRNDHLCHQRRCGTWRQPGQHGRDLLG
jgi:MFS family permease